ncbi:hypothetical protein [Flammeovirga sp. OC4]|uniref:hypothetical protein n=1 Tax=Flammeovirga sp. OC4 TaxID=1382345 RepID=UPI0012E04B2E|nr:hypothetical protein [Flammeovirga sp. OC4]
MLFSQNSYVSYQEINSIGIFEKLESRVVVGFVSPPTIVFVERLKNKINLMVLGGP